MRVRTTAPTAASAGRVKVRTKAHLVEGVKVIPLWRGRLLLWLFSIRRHDERRVENDEAFPARELLFYQGPPKLGRYG